jgi:hypothetical protein
MDSNDRNRSSDDVPAEPAPLQQSRRQFLRQATLSGAALALTDLLAACEEQLPLDPKPARPRADVGTSGTIVQGYASATSVAPGEPVSFCLSSNVATAATVRMTRFGATAPDEQYGISNVNVAPQATPTTAAQTGCGWSPTLAIATAGWPSGVYNAHVQTPDNASYDIMFVVRGSTPSSHPILYQLPVTTYQAYNSWGPSPANEASLYTPGVTQVSYERPYKEDKFREFDLIFVRFVEWAFPGQVDYCTSIDLHANRALLGTQPSGPLNYRLFLTSGHDEYWSPQMRAQVEWFVGNGGNAAFFAGNVCWWAIKFADSANRLLVCNRSGDTNEWFACTFVSGPNPDPQFPQFFNRPEDGLTGVSYRRGVVWDYGLASQVPSRGFVVGPAPVAPDYVVPPLHWVFQGLNVHGGDTVGAGLSPNDDGVVGYEVDCAPLQLPIVYDSNNIPVLDVRDDFDPPLSTSTREGTPASLMVLGVSPLLSGSAWTPPNTRNQWQIPSLQRSTMTLFRNNGLVFCGGSIFWYRRLLESVRQTDPISRIARNVIGTLSAGRPASPILLNPSFETWDPTGTVPANWTRGGSGGWLQSNATVVRCEQYSAYLEASGTSDLWLTQDLQLRNGEYYAVGVWIKAPTAGAFRAAITRPDGSIIASQTYRDRYAGVGRWQFLRFYAAPRDLAATGPNAKFEIRALAGQYGYVDCARIDLL